MADALSSIPRRFRNAMANIAIVVEDEATQRQLLVDYLTRQNFRVSGVDRGAALSKLVERELPAVVLLDIGLPGEDGFALARWLREKSGRIGIIMVTVASDTMDRVAGLETGADDYIAKPFEPRELLARVKSVLRRATGAPVAAGPRVRIGRRVLDLDKRFIPTMTSDDARRLIATGAVTGGMIPKLDTCLDAVDRGVDAAVVLDGRVPHAILLELFTEHGFGTQILAGSH